MRGCSHIGDGRHDSDVLEKGKAAAVHVDVAELPDHLFREGEHEVAPRSDGIVYVVGHEKVLGRGSIAPKGTHVDFIGGVSPRELGNGQTRVIGHHPRHERSDAKDIEVCVSRQGICLLVKVLEGVTASGAAPDASDYADEFVDVDHAPIE